MPLTPADVHNVVFKKPPIGKRGYDDDDVDAFLDEVERELARLIEENNDLKAQLEHAGSGAPRSAGAGDAEARRVSAENNELKKQLDRLHQEKQRAEQAVAAAQQGAGASGGGSGALVPANLTGDSTGEQQALRVLMLAQRTADDHVADARRDADQLLTEARTKADELTRDARSKAEALERDAQQRHQEVMGTLGEKRNDLEKRIETLKSFERQYRTRLKSYLQSQLRELDSRSQPLESEANGRQAANGSNGLAAAYNGPSFNLSDGTDGHSVH